MTALALAKPRHHAARYPGCVQCMACGFTFCDLIADSGQSAPGRQPVAQEMRKIPARRTILRPNDVLSTVPVICSGWALTSVMLSDGSRQILSFLLPGDMVLAALLFESNPRCSVEAITDVTYRAFDREAMRARLFGKADMAEKLAQLWTESKRLTDDLVIDLGRRSAAERVARLMLGLIERQQGRGMTARDSFEVEFPLRQHHIADAVGLTPVHVSKLLSDFRRKGFIRLCERTLTVLEPERLRAVANLR